VEQFLNAHREAPQEIVLGLDATDDLLSRLLKIGVVVTMSVRRVRLAMSEACPYQRAFIAAFHALGAAAR